jgi:hypothetical protein
MAPPAAAPAMVPADPQLNALRLFEPPLRERDDEDRDEVERLPVRVGMIFLLLGLEK